MTFTPDQLNQIANKERGNPIRSNDWNIVVDEVQNLGEQVQEINDSTASLNGDTITGPLTVESNETPLLAVGQTGNIAALNVLPNGRVGVGTTSPRDTLAIRAQGTRQSLISFEDPGGTTRWHLEQNFNGNRPGLNFVETGVADGRLFIGAGGNVGMGTTVPGTSFHVEGVRGTGFNPEDHTVLFRGRNNNRQNVYSILALQGGFQGSSPFGHAINFATFYQANGDIAGVIGASSVDRAVAYGSRGSDYAEWLPRLNPEETMEPGDILGVFGGRVAKRTEGADRVMAVTDRAVVLGNMPDEDQKHLHEKISFIGQVPIKVRGPVQISDYIVPSGLNDGVGVAVAPEQMTLAHCGQIVGQAWEASDEVAVKRVNAAVGLDWSRGVAAIFAAEVANLRTELAALKESQAMAPV